MAMKEPDDLLGICGTLFEALFALGFHEIRNTMINIYNDEKGSFVNYDFSIDGGANRLVIPYNSHPMIEDFISQLKQASGTFTEHAKSGAVLEEWKAFRESSGEQTSAKLKSATALYYYTYAFKNGTVGISNFEPVSEEQLQILERFKNVLNLSYQRFTEIIQAQAQAREAKIETAMERVRARTMAMQKSDELAEVAALLFKQVADLGIKAWTTGFNVWSDDNNSFIDYITSPKGGFIEPYTVDTPLPILKDARARGEDFLVFHLEGEILKEIYQQLSKSGDKQQYEKMVEGGFQLPERQFNHFVFGSKVSLMFITYEPVPEAHDIFKRFGNVFEQTYTRFLDLQKAEAQTREAKIETALERVRARTMAMQKSDELDETSMLLLRQLESLDISLSGIGIHICHSDKPQSEAWMWDMMAGKIPKVTYNHTHDRLSEKIYEGWTRGETLLVEEVKGEKLKEHLEYVSSLVPDPTIYEDSPPAFVFHIAYFTYGFFVLATPTQRPAEHPIFIRFAKVFEQTYTRFLDLQKAEAQAREAQIEAALERVRSRSMAMHKSEEVMDVAVCLYYELQKLDFTFGATSAATIIIMDKKNGQMEHWLAGFIQKNHVESYEVNNIEHPLHAAQLAAWRQGAKFVSIELSGTALKEYAEEMFTQSGYRNLPDEEKAMLSAQEHVVFNLAFMSHGALMWAPSALSDENAIILQRFAKVFEQTYTRFLDLQKAEAQAIRAEQDLIEIKASRKKAEDTLAALKATQKQLIQAEKMASLGELTAGIAHEIQNPLNFVNNFSETNVELVEEAEAELKTGNQQQVFSILTDIKENEQKINHHGRRAENIVKGMLEHSRSSKAEKQEIDINELADEYLKLAYHGFRAKDKSFNANIETDFDESIGKINIVPQDIGRVLLNLYNNAFYAVADKSKQAGHGYEPKVRVRSERVDNKIQIRIEDNGTGIPQAVIDKIYQPFFTTKPTGQGTGLGLSLSYDIIKAHGGELKVESKEGEGSVFTIELAA
jgi:signal transduction histidine kinase